MSAVDVTVHIDIAADPEAVAAVMFAPHREPDWVEAITSVEVLGAAAVAPGARARLTGRLMGRDFAWTSEILAIEAPHRLSLKVEDGPFVGTVSYQIDQVAGGSRVSVRNQGETTVMAFLSPSMVEGPMRTMMSADLARLKGIVETS